MLILFWQLLLNTIKSMQLIIIYFFNMFLNIFNIRLKKEMLLNFTKTLFLYY